MTRDRLVLMTRENDLHTFWQPDMSQCGYFQWWSILDGVLSVVVNSQPRRARCFPLVSIEWWEHECAAEVPGD